MKYINKITKTICPACGKPIQTDKLSPTIDGSVDISFPTGRGVSFHPIFCRNCGCITIPVEILKIINSETKKRHFNIGWR